MTLHNRQTAWRTVARRQEVGDHVTRWTTKQLHKIAAADELDIATPMRDGTLRQPIPIWVVRHGDALYIRSYRGTEAAWYRSTAEHNYGHIDAGGVRAEVTFQHVTDHDINLEIDAAYRDKYARYGPRFVDPMTAPTARDTTLQLIPRNE